MAKVRPWLPSWTSHSLVRSEGIKLPCCELLYIKTQMARSWRRLLSNNLWQRKAFSPPAYKELNPANNHTNELEGRSFPTNMHCSILNIFPWIYVNYWQTYNDVLCVYILYLHKWHCDIYLIPVFSFITLCLWDLLKFLL